MEGHFPRTEQGTGSTGPDPTEIAYPFGRYLIKVALGPGGKFLRIVEVTVRKDLRSVQQRISSTGYHDVSDLYQDEDED